MGPLGAPDATVAGDRGSPAPAPADGGGGSCRSDEEALGPGGAVGTSGGGRARGACAPDLFAGEGEQGLTQRQGLPSSGNRQPGSLARQRAITPRRSPRGGRGGARRPAPGSSQSTAEQISAMLSPVKGSVPVSRAWVSPLKPWVSGLSRRHRGSRPRICSGDAMTLGRCPGGHFIMAVRSRSVSEAAGLAERASRSRSRTP